MATAPHSPLPKNTILSFDGGGVRGLSALLILQRLMRRIYVHEVQRSRTVAARTGLPPPTIAPEGEALPRDYFELVCGTSTGGLIAIMLGRLDMTVEECITEYLDLSASVFGKRNRLFSRYLFDARRLKEAVNSVVQRRLGSPKDSSSNAEHEMHRHDAEEGTKVFVVTLAAKDINGRPRLLRSYSSGPDHSAAKCSITDAAWATAAAPTFFKPPRLQIERGAPHVEFVDGGLGYNNPAELARDELVRHRVMVGQPLIVSIGTGLSDKKSIGSHGWSLRILYILRLARALAHLATSTGTVHANLASQLPEGRYFRFNVDLGLSHIRLDRYELLDDVYIVTNRYLDGVEARRSLDRCAQAVFEERWRSQPLEFGAFLVPHDKGSIPKSHWNRELGLHRRPWYLETVTASDPYPPDVEHSSDSLIQVKPIGNHVVCARNPLNVSLRLFDPNVPAGEYAVVWILCFFGELSEKQRPRESHDEYHKHASGSEPPDYDDLDDAGLHAHPDLFLIAGSPREDIDFQFHRVKTGQADPATLADLGLFRGGAVKHSISERDWQIERGRGWAEIHATSRTLKLTQSGAVGFYISQPARNNIAGWCFGGVRLVPIVEGPTSDGRPGGHQATHSFGSGSILRQPMSRSRPSSPVPMRPTHSRPRARSVGPPTRPPSPTDPASARADVDEAQTIPAFKFGQIDSIISPEVSPTTTPAGLSPPQRLRTTSRRSTSPIVQLPSTMPEGPVNETENK